MLACGPRKAHLLELGRKARGLDTPPAVPAAKMNEMLERKGGG